MHGPAAFDYVDTPALPPSVPRRGNAFTRGLGRFLLWALGWRLAGAFPDTPKFVVVVAPHTSNWDGVIAFPAAMALGLEISFIGKHSLFKGPLGWFLRAMGGIPVNRDNPGGLVDQAIAEFRQRDAFVYGLAPEGTRQRATEWKTGFHRIATAAAVPYVLVTFDYAKRTVGPIATVLPTSDAEHDLAVLGGYFEAVTPKNPDNFELPVSAGANATGS